MQLCRSREFGVAQTRSRIYIIMLHVSIAEGDVFATGFQPRADFVAFLRMSHASGPDGGFFESFPSLVRKVRSCDRGRSCAVRAHVPCLAAEGITLGRAAAARDVDCQTVWMECPVRLRPQAQKRKPKSKPNMIPQGIHV